MVKSSLISVIMVLLSYGWLHAADPVTPSYTYLKANKLFAAAQFKEALALYQKLLTSPPAGVSVGDIRTRIGDSWFRLGSFRNALDAYRTAITEQKQSARPQTQYWIGFCCFLLGRDADAVAEFLKIPQMYPGSGMWVGTAYYWAARASERMGKTKEAAAYYRKAGGNGKSTQARFAQKKAEKIRSKANSKQQAANSK